jgi:cytochrome c553
VSIYLLKSILAMLVLLSGLTASFSMLILMGRVEKKTGPVTLRTIHRTAGYSFVGLILLLSALGTRIFINSGDTLSLRAVLHAYLALLLLFILFLKVILVRFYKQFLRLAPTLGMTMLVLVLVVFSVSAGYYILRTVFGPGPARADSGSIRLRGNIQKGAALFSANCASCHFADREENKMGPGLKNLFQKDRLPFSRKPVTEDNIRQQMIHPARRMPSFSSLAEQEIGDLVAYLKSL